MRIINGAISGVSHLTRLKFELSKRAKKRLKWFNCYAYRGRNGRLICCHFDISHQTFYCCKRHYKPKGLANLEDRSHHPFHVRQPTYSVELVEAVLRLREEYPRWGKDKLVVLLHREKLDCSASMVGRILHKLKERGVLR